MKSKLLIILSIFLTLPFMLSLTSYNAKTSNNQDMMSTNIIRQIGAIYAKIKDKNEFKSEDGSESLFAPKSWANDPELNDEASIQVSNRKRESYVVVIDEEKSAFGDDFTLTQYAETVSEMMQGLIINVSATEITDTSVNGKNGKYFELAGEFENIKVTYFITTVESDSKYYQIIGWTLTPQVEKSKPEILEVMNSFTLAQ